MPLSHRHLKPSVLVFGALTLAAALLSGLYLSHDGAAGYDDGTAVASLAELVPDSNLDPRILGVGLTGSSWRAAVADLNEALFAEADATRRLDRSTADLLDRRGELNSIEQQLASSRAVASSIDGEIADLEELIKLWAVSRFVSFGENEASALASAADSISEDRGLQLAAEVDAAQMARHEALLDRQSTIDLQVRALYAQVENIGKEISALELAITEARGDLRSAKVALDAAIADATSARYRADVAGFDFSVIALDAYLRAEVALAESHPDCGIEWWAIAGVARIESRHGEIGGRWVRPDGRTSSPIIGIALDGGPGVRAIIDTDAGSYDGDATWDRAVGPMQFIPETWTRRSLDGSGDGARDPHNLYDAALTAGRYLCVLGGDLSTEAGRREAYFGYNTSNKYVNDVHGHAMRYAELELTSLDPS